VLVVNFVDFVVVGVCGVKVWKDFGLYVCDVFDELVFLDDECLVGVWEIVVECGILIWWYVVDL